MDKILKNPYIKMLRLGHQPGIVVITLFSALDVGYKNYATLGAITFGFLLLSVMMFLVNDYFDKADTDQFSFRERILAKVPVSQNVVIAIWLAFTLAGSLILLKYGLFFQLALLLFFGNFYTAPPFRFKAVYPWDMIAVAIWLLVGYSTPYILSGTPLIRIVDVPLITLALVLGTSELIHLMTDIEADRKAGLRNTAAVLKPNTLLRLAKICLIGSAVGFAVLVYRHSNWWYYPIIPIIPYIGYALGRVREVMYKPLSGIQTLNTAYNRGVKIGNLLVVYQIIIFVILLYQP